MLTHDVLMDEDAARLWCRAMATRLIGQQIPRQGRPYLTRYFAAGWSPHNRRPGPAVFLHHFVASDPEDSVHSHPWHWSVSLILVGGYREQRCDDAGQMTVREYRPGDVNVLTPRDKHRVDLLANDCWTLFLAGHFDQAWAFFPACG
jgi:hypothetical protein